MTTTRTQDKLSQMMPDDFDRLRAAYYKAVEGLTALHAALDEESSLPEQYNQANKALKILNEIDLGMYL